MAYAPSEQTGIKKEKKDSYLSQINTRQTYFKTCFDGKRKSLDCGAP